MNESLNDKVRKIVGDAWFSRNKDWMKYKYESKQENITKLLEHMNYTPKSVVEIGCANGWRLKILQERYGCAVAGLDICEEALKMGLETLKGDLRVGMQEKTWPWEDESFDTVIFGACLTMADPKKLFYIAGEADRVLKNNGVLIICDALVARPYVEEHMTFPGKEKDYKHYFFKYDFSQIWRGHPGYYFVGDVFDPKNMIDESVTLLYKRMSFPILIREEKYNAVNPLPIPDAPRKTTISDAVPI